MWSDLEEEFLSYLNILSFTLETVCSRFSTALFQDSLPFRRPKKSAYNVSVFSPHHLKGINWALKYSLVPFFVLCGPTLTFINVFGYYSGIILVTLKQHNCDLCNRLRKMSQSTRSHQWSERLIRLKSLIQCYGNMADPVCIRPDSQQGPASDNQIRAILPKDETLMIYLRFLTLLSPFLGLLTRTAADRGPPSPPPCLIPCSNCWLFIPGRCRRFTRSWWESSAFASCCSTMPSTKTQSGENHAFSQLNVFPPRVDRCSIKPTSTIWFYRGDPTLVKINVAITTGYLISGERNTRRAVQVSPKWNKCHNCRIRLIQIFRHIQTVGLLQWHASSTLCFPDLLLIFYYWKAIGDKFFVIHHVAALYAYYYVLVSALLSNSRTCRQDGKETTKSEQLRPPTLGLPI